MTELNPQLTCQEAHATLSRHSYVPCGKPASKSIHSPKDGRSYNMCEFCAAHSVSNRGLIEVGPATPANPDLPVETAALRETFSGDPAPVYDYTGFGDDSVTAEGDLAALSNLAEQQRLHEDEVERLQLELKRAQNALKDVAEHKIPELMDKVGMAKFSTRNGLNISIRETIRASMGSGTAKERNLDWLEEQGHEAVIKMGVEIPFAKGQEERDAARSLAGRLREEGLPATFARKVEPSTLSALIRELLEEGRPVPEEAFGVFRQRVAKIN